MASERGASVVELALVLPLIVALILGMFSGGVAYNRKITMTDAVREGARYGATRLAGTTANPFANVGAWTTAVQQRVAGVSGGELVDTDVCAALVAAPDSVSAPKCGVADPPNTPVGAHVVKVSANKGAKLEAFFFVQSITLKAKAAARYEREP